MMMTPYVSNAAVSDSRTKLVEATPVDSHSEDQFVSGTSLWSVEFSIQQMSHSTKYVFTRVCLHSVDEKMASDFNIDTFRKDFVGFC